MPISCKLLVAAAVIVSAPAFAAQPVIADYRFSKGPDGAPVASAIDSGFIAAFGRQFRARMDDKALEEYFSNINDVRYRETIRSWYESDLNSDLLRQSLQAYHAFLHDMEDALLETGWLAGDVYSLPDIDVIPYLWRLLNLQLGFMWVELPGVTDWFERVTNRAAFRSAIVDPALPDWIEGMRAAGREARSVLRPIVEAFHPVVAQTTPAR